MRALKFRVWDRGHNTLSYKVNLYSMNHQGVTDKAQIDNQQVMKAIGFACEVMQFTGNSDINQKEIFEGDILKWQDRIAKVEWVDDYGGFVIRWAYSKNQHHQLLTCDLACQCEVVGNIYETPHLLKP